MTIVNGFQPLTIITKHSILDVAAVLDPPLQLNVSPKSLESSKLISDALAAYVNARSIVNFNVSRFNDRFYSHSKVNQKSKTFVTSQIKLNFGCVSLLLKIPERTRETLSFCSTDTL